MKATKRSAVALALAALICAARPASADLLVIDAARLRINIPEYVKIAAQLALMQQQLQEAIKTVAQAQAIYAAANQLTHTNDIASGLNDLRTIFPGDGTGLMDTTGAGGSGAALYASSQLFHQGTAADSSIPASVLANGASIASFIAQGQAIYQQASARVTGLEQLRTALSSSHDEKTTQDLKARIQVESAGAANDIMRIQGLRMMQTAQTAQNQLADTSSEHCRNMTMSAFYSGKSDGSMNCASQAQTVASTAAATANQLGTGAASVAGSYSQYLGTSVGSGQCVALVQAADPSVGLTATWREGEAVSSASNLAPGTVIATFGSNGTYTNSLDGSSHAAIYQSTNADGSINVIDQWTGQPAHERTIYNVGGKSAANTASDFHVVSH